MTNRGPMGHHTHRAPDRPYAGRRTGVISPGGRHPGRGRSLGCSDRCIRGCRHSVPRRGAVFAAHHTRTVRSIYELARDRRPRIARRRNQRRGRGDDTHPLALVPTLTSRVTRACHDAMLTLLRRVGAKFAKPFTVAAARRSDPTVVRRPDRGSPASRSSQRGRCRRAVLAVTASREPAGRVGSCKMFPCGSRSRDAARAPGAPSRSARCSRGCGW